ncbi:MAG: DUF2335 domain-containing protein [Bacteroidales bacterium]
MNHKLRHSNGKVLRQQITQAYSGPIPPPEALEKYEQIQPGFAERIMRLAEGEALHRRGKENILVKNAVEASRSGNVFAFISVLAFCLLIGFALYLGQDVAALTLVIASIGSVAGLFIYMRRQKEIPRN